MIIKNNKVDIIRILGMELQCIIGTLDHERKTPQTVIADIELHTDLQAACQSDDLGDTIDYAALHDEIANSVATSSFFLIERLAGFVADICLSRPTIKTVTVRIGKPQALGDKDVRTVEVEITRSQNISDKEQHS